MKKYILILALGFFSFVNAQSARGMKIGYFDMNHILKSVPEFAEANNQLELRAQTWKKEIDDRQAQINLLVEELKTERVLLTKELIEEKEDEIAFLQKELSDYQQKRFGPIGDLYTQKAVLVKPIQDQVFTIVSDIAERRNYDLIYDMSSASGGLVVANRRYDMNDEIIRLITREANQARKRMSKEEELAEHDKEFDPDLREREEERQAKVDERQQRLDDRRAEQEQKRQEQLEKRQEKQEERKQQLEERRQSSDDEGTDDKPARPSREEREAQIAQRKKEIQEQREQRKKEIEQKREERKKELEEKRNNRNQNQNNQNQESSSNDENEEK